MGAVLKVITPVVGFIETLPWSAPPTIENCDCSFAITVGPVVSPSVILPVAEEVIIGTILSKLKDAVSVDSLVETLLTVFTTEEETVSEASIAKVSAPLV